MTGTRQSVKESCNLFIEPNSPVSSFRTTCHTFLKFAPRIVRYDDISYQENRGSIARSLDANARNTTPVKMTGSAIL